MSPRIGLGKDAVDHGLERPGAHADVEKAGRGDLDRFDRRRRRRRGAVSDHLGRQQRGELERRPSVRSGELHRQVRREVPVLRFGRSFDLHDGTCCVIEGRERTLRDRALPGVLDGAADLGAERGWDHALHRTWVGRTPEVPGRRQDRSLLGSNEFAVPWAVGEGLVWWSAARGTRPARTLMGISGLSRRCTDTTGGSHRREIHPTEAPASARGTVT